MTSAAGAWNKDRGTRFYRFGALTAIAVALAGFFLTYLQPMAQGRFSGPVEAHVHGMLLASWLVLVCVQSCLLRSHRTLGWLAVALAPAIALSTMAIGVAATRRDLAAGIELGMAGNVTAPLIFCGLVAAAIALRRQPQWHKRLIFIATVAMLWPAWFRWRHFLPWVPRPDIVLGLVVANLPVAVAMLRDRLKFGVIHPAYFWVGLPVVAEQTFETMVFGTPLWTGFGMYLFRILG
ncbi:MAG TPA: hypothetical protein VFV30_02735 [Novosphingobium sp.]|nr:hypothetical protein [Novosphingobium sp.]